MTGALIILLVTVAVGTLLYVYDLKWRRQHASEGSSSPNDLRDFEAEAKEPETESHGSICCGRHLVCDKSLNPLPGEVAEYYEDEELDRFAGRRADKYSADEVEEIREVMMTLLPQDVAGWVRSMQLRGIEIPDELRDELFIMLDC